MESHRRVNCVNVEPDNSSIKPTEKCRTRKKVITRKISARLEAPDQALLSFRDFDAAKKFYKRRIKMLSSVACVMGLVSAVLALVDIELTTRGRVSDEELSPGDLRTALDNPNRLAALVVKSVLSVLSLLTSFTIYRMNVNELSYLIVRNIYHESERFVMTSLFPTCLVEVVLCLFHVPPLLDHYGMPYELQLLVFLRLYLMAKYVKEHNMFVDNRATALFASVTQTEISSIFLIKAYFLKFPFQLIFTFYSLNIFLGGYCVYVIDRAHNTYLDTVWMLVVTMTTLGFGDVVPKAILARAFVGFASVLGIFLMALFISVVHESLQLKQQEKRILATMENADHHSGKKNLAATCIQNTWRLHRFIQENTEPLVMGDWFKSEKLRMFQHKLAESVRRWRIARKSWSRDDYWKKFFLADDIAMLLTDVSRSIGNVENFLQKQNVGRRTSRNSLKSIGSPPTILEGEQSDQPTLRDKNRKIQAVFVDSWRPSNTGQTKESPATSRRTYSDTSHTHPGHLQHLSLTYGHDNQTSHAKLNELTENGRVTHPTCRSRLESDPIDRGDLPADALQGKVESLENSLDQIYRKMKTELRDVRESIRMINRYSAGSSSSMSPSQSMKNNSMYPYRYSRTTDHVDV
ncbi:intermediate conductance calcium-activated potassium channel protein 4 isoform X3 [Pocillopora verrucosa]|nr:small conductance calcium-activated potassium channel protein 2-like isoform X3 [Pocillopora verrucosa]XP_058960695.1 small conductance calcium-activated potassium channel protein 2-like isoform X3 [Pocillopora verrucosa]